MASASLGELARMLAAVSDSSAETFECDPSIVVLVPGDLRWERERTKSGEVASHEAVLPDL